MTKFLLENKDFFSGKRVVVLCHDFHWNNIKLLINQPPKDIIWNYYFVGMGGRYFDFKLQSVEDIRGYLQSKNRKTLLKHWDIISDL